MTAPRHVIHKVNCPRCSRFAGVITSDGNGPYIDECLECPKRISVDKKDPDYCPLLVELNKFQPRAA